MKGSQNKVVGVAKDLIAGEDHFHIVIAGGPGPQILLGAGDGERTAGKIGRGRVGDAGDGQLRQRAQCGPPAVTVSDRAVAPTLTVSAALARSIH